MAKFISVLEDESSPLYSTFVGLIKDSGSEEVKERLKEILSVDDETLELFLDDQSFAATTWDDEQTKVALYNLAKETCTFTGDHATLFQ